MTITAKLLADSIPPRNNGKRLLSFEWRYPRFIHAEALTHRVFSRNSSSSRATPIQAQIDIIKSDPAIPVRWGLNGKGMQDHGEMTEAGAAAALKLWLEGRDKAVQMAGKFLRLGEVPHKQIINRILEPWAHITVVVTSTEWTNFFALRRHADAQPEIRELADKTWEAMQASTPKVLKAGQWHLPYIQQFELEAAEGRPNATNDLIKVSVARCARTSYRNHSNRVATFEEDVALHDKLIAFNPAHPSPAEHQATPDTFRALYDNGKLDIRWNHPELSGNFADGWIQYRKMLPNENITVYTGEH